ncbi:MAG: type II toxin-antitoxin system death-on-curing family toxin [Patescibacteria group bacterium]|jgi:death-on-curing protein
MTYLDGEEVLVLHARMIELIGGSHGVRDAELLKSILEAPKQRFGGKALHATVWEKAAVYLERFAQFHVFVDGNKRTAIIATARFLYLNGYTYHATNTETERFVLRVTTEKLDMKEIAAWLKNHSKKQ